VLRERNKAEKRKEDKGSKEERVQGIDILTPSYFAIDLALSPASSGSTLMLCIVAC
jgi:hypothetical protein